MVSGGITQDGLPKSKVDLCGVCTLRVDAYSVLCLQYGNWTNSRCAGLKRTQNVKEILDSQWSRKKC